MWAMVVKEFRELRRDRRTMALLIGLPILLLLVFGYAANFNVTSIPTVVTGPEAEPVAKVLPEVFDVKSVDPSASAQDAQDEVRDGNAEVAFSATAASSIGTTDDGTGTPTVVAYIDGGSLFTAQASVAAIARVNVAAAASGAMRAPA